MKLLISHEYPKGSLFSNKFRNQNLVHPIHFYASALRSKLNDPGHEQEKRSTCKEIFKVFVYIFYYRRLLLYVFASMSFGCGPFENRTESIITTTFGVGVIDKEN